MDGVVWCSYAVLNPFFTNFPYEKTYRKFHGIRGAKCVTAPTRSVRHARAAPLIVELNAGVVLTTWGLLYLDLT